MIFHRPFRSSNARGDGLAEQGRKRTDQPREWRPKMEICAAGRHFQKQKLAQKENFPYLCTLKSTN
jgi:hypothetical protein